MSVMKNYTLWPFWIDTHVTPPMIKKGDGFVYDGSGKKIKYYNDVPDILEKLKSEGYSLGIASRTEWPEGAKQLLKLLDWEKYFEFPEIYPGRKTTHFKRFQEKTNYKYQHMLFFDDEERNIRDVRQLGVTSILVPNGISHHMLKEGLNQFARNNQ
ncbi:magnesium-dependent phosphatase 1-like isoform X1 [Centruroides sculpturatus]|uniref:magnesium-dependent phosphatase 1-like isoform X1 n=2 Tax=Centruroides sculpturatus TaxID=218467 RepID=UPI000C6D715F|nr:magnesium-dependent phosphatase 1-like isoform X1 [Centruroides sculpturatus]